MSKYGYYSKNNISREIITSKEALDEIEAINIFSKIKNLTPNQFTDLYEVIKR